MRYYHNKNAEYKFQKQKSSSKAVYVVKNKAINQRKRENYSEVERGKEEQKAPRSVEFIKHKIFRLINLTLKKINAEVRKRESEKEPFEICPAIKRANDIILSKNFPFPPSPLHKKKNTGFETKMLES